MNNVQTKALRLVVGLAGVFTIFVGINVAFGGILTLGLMGQTQFLAITDVTQYLVQDSHVRFFGGMYGGAGILLLVAAVTDLHKSETAVKVVFVLFFMGGLARFTMLRPDVVFGPAIVGSLAAELILMPILYVWVTRRMSLTR